MTITFVFIAILRRFDMRATHTILLIKEVVACGTFTGTASQMTFSSLLPLLTAKKYQLCGQLVQWSVSQGGPGIPVLLPSLYSVMVGRPLESPDDVEHMGDSTRKGNFLSRDDCFFLTW